ncbi:restriction endonuclease subunit S [Vreelandella glaciei]|jgi:type I restriction enzyme S subunit|uniref:restriction endonuclease subunit S n=1 Tax=Vreelandella glaciei TaxID=186761 RepID=UPI0030EE880F|tara:strand:- start:162 stop:1700 length:1539 start_codon:yes stop_codon:yes gene_type:complete
MPEHQLSQGWVISAIQNLISIDGLISDGDWIESKDQDPNGSIRLVQLADIGDGDFRNKSQRFMSEEKASLLNCTFLEEGDVLIARMPDPLGRACLFPGVGQPAVTVVDVCLIRAGLNPAITNHLLKYWINSPSFRGLISENASGTTRKRITRKKLEKFEIPLPPLAEQKVIADKLDTLLAQVENTKARLERIPQILKRFRQSVLAAAVSGRLTEEWRAHARASSIYDLIEQWAVEREELKSEKRLKKNFGPKSDPSPIIEDVPQSWAWVKFDHIAEHSNNSLKAGPFGSALKKSDSVDSGFKVYGQEQVIAGDEQLVTYYVNSQKYKQLNACSVKPGDILISLVGTIGKILVLSEEAETGIINPRLVKLSLQQEINKTFIQIYLESPVAHDFFRGFSHGGTMEILNLGILKELPIPLPPLEEQTEIVRRVDQLFTQANRIEQQVNNALARVNNLTQSILAKAFRGELTEQWRKDNPDLISGENSAEALLERIKAEREAANKPAKKTRKHTTA